MTVSTPASYETVKRFVVPPQMAHSLWAVKTTVLQVTGTGPFDLHYIDPKDDPRNDKNDPRNKK